MLLLLLPLLPQLPCMMCPQLLVVLLPLLRTTVRTPVSGRRHPCTGALASDATLHAPHASICGSTTLLADDIDTCSTTSLSPALADLLRAASFFPPRPSRAAAPFFVTEEAEHEPSPPPPTPRYSLSDWFHACTSAESSQSIASSRFSPPSGTPGSSIWDPS